MRYTMKHTFENRAAFKPAAFFWLLECYIAPVLLFGPVAMFTEAVNVHEYVAIAFDPILDIFAVFAYILLPLLMYTILRKKFAAYDGSEKSIRSTNLFFKFWYNLNIGLVISLYIFLAFAVIIPVFLPKLFLNLFKIISLGFLHLVEILEEENSSFCKVAGKYETSLFFPKEIDLFGAIKFKPTIFKTVVSFAKSMLLL